MNATLAEAISLLSFAIAPGLLVIRFFRPRILPRWAVLMAAAVLGGSAFYVSELLYRADMLQRFGAFTFPPPTDVSGVVVLQSPRPVDFVFGAILQLVYLLLWLVPYGVTQILLERRRQLGRVAA